MMHAKRPGVFTMLSAILKLNPEKFIVCPKEIIYLSYTISKMGITTDQPPRHCIEQIISTPRHAILYITALTTGLFAGMPIL